MKKELLLSILAIGTLKAQSQCVNDFANIYAFNVNNIPYEIVLENKTWAEASACAVERGGKLTEINSKEKQDTIFYYLNQAGINVANTIAPDGGGASYVWIGGNDLATEGKWIWNGDNTGASTQFWQGTSSGSVVGGLYNNWGNEPDNWNGQDGLGLAVTNWPLGLAGQWNDVDETNALYYVIEYPEVITTSLLERKDLSFSISPNPAEDEITIKIKTEALNSNYKIINQLGNIVIKGVLKSDEMKIELSELAPGIYIFLMEGGENYRMVKN